MTSYNEPLPCRRRLTTTVSSHRHLFLMISLLFLVRQKCESFLVSSTRKSIFLHGSESRDKPIGDVFDVDQSQVPERPPIPAMPSDMFRRMAHSQLELLAFSLTAPGDSSESKVESMALYLPQENVLNGQLEFTPVVLYPDPNTERVFIASDAASGQAPTLPRTLTKLPGFAHATTLLPGYPMMSSDSNNPGIGVVEEVMCDARYRNKPAALSVPLLSGSQTVGVLLVSPSLGSNPNQGNVWTDLDREQVSRAAQSLSMALSMDSERNVLKEQNNAFREGLSDSLHQVKSPLQALRTYGKLLQRQLASTTELRSGTPALLELTERLMVQSERVIDLMVPMDTLVENLEQSTRLALQPAKVETPKSLVVRSQPFQLLPWEKETLDFARENSTSHENFNNTKYREFNQKRLNREAARQKPRRTPVRIVGSSTTGVVGDLEVEMTFVADVLEPITSAFCALAPERGIKFEVIQDSSELPGVMAAPKALQEAISNILDNAFKYVLLPRDGSPFLKNPSPHVRLRMMLNRGGEPGVVIVVEDNGPGIREGDHEAIFQRGFRAEKTSDLPGSGIGLDISRTLVEGMGGSLEVAHSEEFEDALIGAIIKCTLFRRKTSTH